MFKSRLVNSILSIIAEDLLDTRHRRRRATFCDLAIFTTAFGFAAAGGFWGARLFTGGLGIVLLGFVGLILGFLVAYSAFHYACRLFGWFERRGLFTVSPPPNNALQRTEAGGGATSDINT